MGINALIDFEFFAGSIDLDFFLVAMPYTLLDQKSLTTAMKVCVKRGIKIVLGAPFASGLLTNPNNLQVRYNYGPVPKKFVTCPRASKELEGLQCSFNGRSLTISPISSCYMF